MLRGKCPVTGKVQYTSLREARMVLDKLKVRRMGHKTERSAYQCGFCPHWHITCMAHKQDHTPRLAPHRRWRWRGIVTDDEE